MQNFFVQIDNNGNIEFHKFQSENRKTLLHELVVPYCHAPSAIKKVVEVGSREYEKFPANAIKNSAGLFKLVIDKMDTSRGAPMGRGNVEECPIATDENGLETFEPGKTFDRRVELDGGGYDAGGAYWGRGTELRVTYNEDLTFVRFYRR